jgi:tripartite-type tricarboxylate transporter receptor subunit TctC
MHSLLPGLGAGFCRAGLEAGFCHAGLEAGFCQLLSGMLRRRKVRRNSAASRGVTPDRGLLMTVRSSLVLALGVAFAATLAPVAQAAEAEADFYRGKQIKLMVSTEPGTIYDVYARLMADHMPNHIPGKPSFVVENAPGASGLRVTNFMASQAPKDGLTMAAVHSSIPTAPLTSPEGARFDAAKLGWIGSITKDPFVAYVWHTVPVYTLADAEKVPFSIGGNAIGSAGIDLAILCNEMFGFKMKIITGYAGSLDTKLAMERREVDGTFGNGWGDINTTRPHWIKDKLINIFAQHGFTKHPDLPTVPLLIDYAKKPEDRQTLEFMLARQEFSKPYFVPEGTPAARVEILRKAFDATLKDPAFLAGAAKAKLPVEGPMGGEELAAMVAKVSATPDSIVKGIEARFEKFKQGR